MNVPQKRQRCETLVITIVGKAMASTWWNSPNKAFDEKTPEAQFAESSDTVYTYLMTSRDGEW